MIKTCEKCGTTLGDKETICAACGKAYEAATPILTEDLGESPTPANNIDDHLQQIITGQGKLMALKVYKEHANCSLAEAKSYIDTHFPENNSKENAPSSKSGCMSVVLTLIIVTGSMYCIFASFIA